VAAGLPGWRERPWMMGEMSMVVSDHRDSELSSGGSVVGVMSVAEEGDEGVGQYWR